MAWVVTLVGSLIVGIIVFEYGYYRKKRERDKLALTVARPPNVPPLWFDTVSGAVEKLCEREKVKLEAIPTLKVLDDTAIVIVRTSVRGYTRFYDLKIDKSGDILEIQTR